MNRATAVTREKSAAKTSLNTGNDKLAIGVIGGTSLLIGCWALVCLVAGTISSGGPAGLVAHLISAISG